MDLVFRSPKSSWVLEQTSKARCSPLIWAPTIWTPAIWTRVEQELKRREIEEEGVRGGGGLQQCGRPIWDSFRSEFEVFIDRRATWLWVSLKKKKMEILCSGFRYSSTSSSNFTIRLHRSSESWTTCHSNRMLISKNKSTKNNQRHWFSQSQDSLLLSLLTSSVFTSHHLTSLLRKSTFSLQQQFTHASFAPQQYFLQTIIVS